MKQLNLTILALLLSIASFAQVAAISGPGNICLSSTATYTDATPAGTWTSANTSILTIGATSGIATPLITGTVDVVYTVGASFVTYSVTVDALPAPITGVTDVCVGGTVPETDATPGGLWSSAAPAVATIDGSGNVTGISPGTTTIMYADGGTGCMITEPMTVNPLPAPIGGAPNVCVGSTTTLTDVGGGTWSTSNASIATAGVGSGIITGVSAGSATIYYTLGTSCASSTTVTVYNATGAVYSVTGGGGYCVGGAGLPIGLSSSISGTSYQLYNGASPVGSPVAGTGTGFDFGTETVSGTYTVVGSTGGVCFTGMSGSATITINPLPTAFAVTGTGSYCSGGTGVPVGLSNSVTGIEYQLYLGTSAVGAYVAGTGSSIPFGSMTAAGTYTVEAYNPITTCAKAMTGTAVITVNALPTVYTVSTGGSYCAGGTGVDVSLGGSSAGIAYQLYAGGSTVGSPVAGSGSSVDFGLLTGAGTYTIVGTDVSTGCTSNMTGSAIVTINPLPAIHTVTGGGNYCSGGTGVLIGLDASNAGFNYQLYDGVTAIGATVAGTGSALNFGMQTASGPYTTIAINAITMCTVNMTSTANVTIDPLPSVTATASSSCGGTVTLASGGAASYSWTPSTGLSCGTCSSATLMPTGSASYTVTGTDTLGCVNTASVSVDGNRISGTIYYTGSSTDVFRVWLIQFHAYDSSIVAVDSTNSCMSGGVPYYEFDDAATGSYMVKAMLMGTVPGTSGYIPTYSYSSPHWDAAATVSHTNAADTMNISMVYGSVPSGPGFISGYVISGAGKGTSTDIPAANMLIYLKDASGNILTYTYTASDGTYSFGSLANGTYIIYPESYKYYTTPSTTVTLSPADESINGIDFKQHTEFGTITPFITTKVQPAPVGSSLTTFPNPTSGNLNIQWSNEATGSADLVITDVMGREVIKTVVNMNTASGQAQINLSSLNDGIYAVTIKSGSIYYTGKIVKQQ